MEIEKTNALHVPSFETKKFIEETVNVKNPDKIEHPALQRCIEKKIDEEQLARQAYSRMHHRHNRS